MSTEQPQSQSGFAILAVVLLTSVVALALATSIIWIGQLRSVALQENQRIEFQRESSKMQTAALALLRRNMIENQSAILQGINRDALRTFVTVDPRFPARAAGAIGTPGFDLLQLAAPPEPDLFVDSAVFATPEPGIIFGSLRQVAHQLKFTGTLSRRTSVAQSDDSRWTRGIELSLTLREIPLTEFSLVAWESLRADEGLEFRGPALLLGSVQEESPGLGQVVSANRLDDSLLPVGALVHEVAQLAGSLLVPPQDLARPDANGPQQQVVSRRGTIIHFDGQSLYSEAAIPPAISVRYLAGARRVVINIAALPLANAASDPDQPYDPETAISAYHIECTTPLARDRGTVIVGTSDGRVGDAFSTNGALRLSGQHDGGPVLIASSFGGVRFLDAVSSTSWNAYLLLAAQPSYVSASSRTDATGARPLVLADGFAAVRSPEVAHDSVGLQIELASANSAFRAAFAAENYGPDLLWIEANGSEYRVGATTPAGTLYSSTMPQGSGTFSFSYSRTQNAVRVVHDGVQLTWDLPVQRPRVELGRFRWSGSISELDVVVNPCGTTIGGAAAGATVTLRGLMTSGTIRRFGEGSFLFERRAGGDRVERLSPRILVAH